MVAYSNGNVNVTQDVSSKPYGVINARKILVMGASGTVGQLLVLPGGITRFHTTNQV